MRLASAHIRGRCCAVGGATRSGRLRGRRERIKEGMQTGGETVHAMLEEAPSCVRGSLCVWGSQKSALHTGSA
eukprot:365930-Chlamydomonas_euryale.AAC.21